MHKTQAKNSLVHALAAEYAHQIKALKEEQEAEIENLYREFRRKYQCLMTITEAQEGDSATSLTDSSAAPSQRDSLAKSTYQSLWNKTPDLLTNWH